VGVELHRHLLEPSIRIGRTVASRAVPTPGSTADAPALLALAVRLAGDAGRLILEGRARGLTDVRTKSTATDVATEYDRESEAFITGALHRERPDDAIVGEEGADLAGTSNIRWYVDPIDGTTNYLYDIPAYGVSIAAADEHGTLVGVVAAPALGELYTAVRGEGAFCNGRPIRCNDIDDLGQALVGTGFGYQADRRARQGAVMAHLLPHVRDMRRGGAASVDLCYVASGRYDVFFEEGLMWWDMAAGELIAIEAGAVSTDFGGGPGRPAQLIVSAPGVAEAFRAALLAAGAPVMPD
jgi:myo-inositol-1(or 4)-monophosphatase